MRAGRAWQAATTTRVVAPLEAAGIEPARRRAASSAAEAPDARWRPSPAPGAEVTLVNRGAPRGSSPASCSACPGCRCGVPPERFDLIVHATTLADESPFDTSRIAGAVVVDLVYREAERPH